jgi:peptide/nickel transport system permease protein
MVGTARSVIRRFNGEMRWGFVIVVAVLVLSVLVPLLSPHPVLTSAGPPLAGPSTSHWFGTDQLGRDVFVRTWAAGRLDIFIALLGVSIPLILGTTLGGILGTSTNRSVNGVWTFIIDSINVFPFFVLVIAVVAIVGPGVKGVIIALAAVNWARYAKIARTRATVVRDEEYIVATRVLGYTRRRVVVRHVLPNTFSETLAYGLSDFVIVIVTVSALSFLGAGVRPPTAEWGAMMADGRVFLRTEWWITVFPGLALSVTAAGVALFTQGLAGRLVGRA